MRNKWRSERGSVILVILVFALIGTAALGTINTVSKTIKAHQDPSYQIKMAGLTRPDEAYMRATMRAEGIEGTSEGTFLEIVAKKNLFYSKNWFLKGEQGEPLEECARDGRIWIKKEGRWQRFEEAEKLAQEVQNLYKEIGERSGLQADSAQSYQESIWMMLQSLADDLGKKWEPIGKEMISGEPCRIFRLEYQFSSIHQDFQMKFTYTCSIGLRNGWLYKLTTVSDSYIEGKSSSYYNEVIFEYENVDKYLPHDLPY